MKSKPTLDESKSNASPSNFESASVRLLQRVSAQLEELTLVERFRALGEDQIVEFIHSDKKVRFFLPYALKDFIQRVILKTNSFYENVDLEKFRGSVPDQSIIVDAGANIGNHAVFFATICGAKKVFAFEPMVQTFDVLRRNATLNGPDTIECINAALGAVEGRADLLGYRSHNMGAARVGENAGGSYRLTTIDALALAHVDIIKIDVEGSQSSVLEGSRDTLSRCSPKIWMERNPAGEQTIKHLGYTKVTAISKNNLLYERQ